MSCTAPRLTGWLSPTRGKYYPGRNGDASQVGGFWLREAALYDDEGVCLAVANLPESYKPLLAEGSGRLQSVNLWIAVSNTADVELKADPSVIMATVEEVTRAKTRRRITRMN